MSFLNFPRFLIFSGLLVGTLLTFSGAVHAATTADVGLSGSVSSTLAITSTATAGASTLALDGAASGVEQIVKVADFSMSTNNEQGLSLSVPAGNLTKSGGTAIAYLVNVVTDGASAPATGAFASGTQTYTTSAAGSAVRDLYIKYTPAALQDPGTYTGTITLTVTDQ